MKGCLIVVFICIFLITIIFLCVYCHLCVFFEETTQVLFTFFAWVVCLYMLGFLKIYLFLLANNYFTILCWLLPYINMNQP